MYKLFLDDIRTSPTNEWVIVRNYEQFYKIVRDRGLPSHISFDHDLGDDIARELVSKGVSKRKARASKKEVKSGYDCAKWLVEYCYKNKLKLPICTVHSMNPVGKQNILFILESYEKTTHDLDT